MVLGGAENQLPSQETLVLPKAAATAFMALPDAMIPRLVFKPGPDLAGEVAGGVEGALEDA